MAQWFSDLELDNPSFFNQWQGDCYDLFSEQLAVVSDQSQNHGLLQSISSESNTNTAPIKFSAPVDIPERPKKIAKTTSWDSGVTEQSSTSPTILSFGVPTVTAQVHAGFYGGVTGSVKQPKQEVVDAVGNNKRGYDAMVGGEGLRKGGSHTGSSQEHILAERKRREKLSQKFIALSKIVPGLKKMDKASVLGDAIKYLKELQDKVQDLEAQAIKKTVESAVIVKKSQLVSDEDDEADNNSSCDENFNNQGSLSKGLPEIEAKMSERTVLIKVHCENRKGALVKVLAQIEALGLSITSTNVMPFAGSSLDITAMAQVEEEFSMSVKDVVKKLNKAFKQFM
ncbi:basic helix-loop-helix (bHLH) DNA-binding superfamily protein [Rhynchospora pubera]|uniref:Basic helix-loop-helix (BHLH) DNA-binding superfamily protein n=1 Tax=Rhynchospora pubera TaxID=906938 RepID=A0AAV8D3Q3_9POAL|nr:basic helix-loop-helix (bHLH) DNA-binding superfamily protein [Rhynchospora pubera]